MGFEVIKMKNVDFLRFSLVSGIQDYTTSLFGLGCPPPSIFTIFGCNEISICTYLGYLNARQYAKFHPIGIHAPIWILFGGHL